ncbi:hypothetical protein FKW77_009387 [Venturia effusa]|uniref:Uncharacterized protein n=1 Tax=Venturia effusa TaxID=50376 RepID=A0A517L044_9PEZI|nr:hypothetical protein FKW77_009387 [Venturia effusa]
MKLVFLPIVCLFGGTISAHPILEKRQFLPLFPGSQQTQPEVQLRATGALIQRAWGEVGQSYSALTTAFRCVSAASANPPPNLLLNCGVGEAHKAIASKLYETTSRFAPDAVINYIEAGSSMLAASTSLTMVENQAFRALDDNWAVSVRTGERQLVYESLVQQLGLFNTWAKAYNNLMPIGTKTAGDMAEAGVVRQYQALIKKYQWDAPS